MDSSMQFADKNIKTDKYIERKYVDASGADFSVVIKPMPKEPKANPVPNIEDIQNPIKEESYKKNQPTGISLEEMLQVHSALKSGKEKKGKTKMTNKEDVYSSPVKYKKDAEKIPKKKTEKPKKKETNLQKSRSLSTGENPLINDNLYITPSQFADPDPTMPIDIPNSFLLTFPAPPHPFNVPLPGSSSIPITYLTLPGRHRPSPLSFSNPEYLVPSGQDMGDVNPMSALSQIYSKGPPPAYATIDPRKFRARHVRPAIFNRMAYLGIDGFPYL